MKVRSLIAAFVALTVGAAAGDASDPQTRVVYDRGRAFIEVDGERIEPDLDLDWSNCAQGYAFNAKTRALGFRIYGMGLWVSRGVETASGGFDFTALDRQIEKRLAAVPDALFELGVWLDFPKWCKTHPDDLIGYADGAPGDDPDEHHGRPVRPSAASAAFRQEVGRFFKALGDYVRSKPWGRRIVMVRPAWGVYCEWHCWGMYHFPDTGKAMTAAFHRWNGGKWAGTALPTVEERIREGGWLDPVRDAKTLDYYRCMAETIADFLLFCCREAKSALPGRLVGAYYGYVMAHHPPEGATVLLEKVLSAPEVDFLSNPSMYTVGSRRAGGSYYHRTIAESFRRHGKLVLIEDDMRFHHIRDTITSRSGLAVCTETPRESRMTMRRNYANRLFDGGGLQINDPMSDTFGKRPHAYDNPDVLLGMREAMDVVRKVGAVASVTGNDTAIVVDPLSRLQRSSRLAKDVKIGSLFSCQEFLYRTGMTFDMLTEDDLRASKTSYAHVIFLSSLVDSIPDSVERWRACLESRGVTAIAPAGTCVRRRGDLLMFHVAGAGTYPLSVPQDLRGRRIVEMFDGVEYSGDTFEVVTDGCDTKLFRFVAPGF